MNNSHKSFLNNYAGWVILFVFFLGSISPRPVLAADLIYRVIPEGISSGACGDSWSTACTLQNAIALSGTGDQIWVAAGTYKPTSSTDRAINFTLKNGVAVYGGFAGIETELSQRDPIANVTLLSGDIGTAGDITDNSYHVIYGPNLSSSSVVDGFTISWGNANGDRPTAKDRGGGIYFYQSSATLRNLTISNNSTSNLGGGMAITYGSNPSLTNVVFSNNTGLYGGAIYSLNSDPILTDVFFYSNTATLRGGGMYNNSGTPALTRVTFQGNNALELGGGICNSSSNPILTEVSFADNSAVVSGGGMYSAGGIISLENVTFSGNSATNGGGMLNSTGSSVSLQTVNFDGNSAVERGGGMYNFSSSPSLTDVTFQNNHAQQYGGGLFNSGSNPVLLNVTFTGNSSDIWGGGLDNNSSSPTLTNVVFSNNHASTSGGAVHNWEYSSPTFTNVLIENNTAGARGGGFYNVDYCDFTLTDVTFRGNTAQDFGGGMFTSNSDPTLTRVTFDSNSTPNYGGGIYNSYTDITLVDITFMNNSAGMYGGGMANNNTDAIMRNITFSANTAQFRAGGLYNYQSDPVLTNITFVNNIAVQEYGGAIFGSAGSLNANSLTLTGNQSGTYGGGLAIDETTTTVENSIFWGNTAGNTGGQIFSFHTGMPMINDSFIENGCPEGGVCQRIYTSNPQLGALTDNGGYSQTVPLQTGSSAIDLANDATCPLTDQRGITRPQGSKCDIGAYEYIGPTFADVPYDYSVTLGGLNYPLYAYIEAIYDAGYTKGCSLDPLKYCPDQTMTRAESAVFMLRGNFGNNYIPPAEPWGTFADNWTLAPWAEKWAEGMWDANMTAGCQTNPLKFCPWDAFNREQAAVFGLRMKYGMNYTPPAASGTVFADMTSSSYWATKWAEQAYADGILTACGTQGGKPLFCPSDQVTRAWGAYIVVQAKGLSLP